MEEVIAPMVVTGVMTVAVVWITVAISNNNRRRKAADTQAAMQSKLLDKLSTSQDLAEFLKTEAGQRLLQSAGPEIEPVRPPYTPILRSVQTGVILALCGLAFLALAFWEVDPVDSAPFRVLGILGGAVGLGFLISSWISYTLGKSWGLFNGKGTAPR
jgi:hypothetical protein